MSKTTSRLPDYVTIIGEGTEVNGRLRFSGGMHIDGTVVGDVIGESEDGCALTLGQGGTVQGNIDVAHVVLDGVVIGDVRASQRAELASGACIDGNLHYGDLLMAVGAKVNGKLLSFEKVQAPRFDVGDAAAEGRGVAVRAVEVSTISSAPDGHERSETPLPGDRNT